MVPYKVLVSFFVITDFGGHLGVLGVRGSDAGFAAVFGAGFVLLV